MSKPVAMFDPYHKWLGIAPWEQPPSHYRLLGIANYEQDREVIERAADRQMVYLRTFQSGPQRADCQRLLNEIAAARACLLDPAKKTPYDQELRARLNAKTEVQIAAKPGAAGPTIPAPPPPATAPAKQILLPAPPPSARTSDSSLSDRIILAPPIQEELPLEPGLDLTPVTGPVLVSAVVNLLLGLALAFTGVGLIVAVPLFILCGFEFAFQAKFHRVPLPRWVREAQVLGAVEICVGLCNPVTLVCGILVLLNAGKIGR